MSHATVSIEKVVVENYRALRNTMVSLQPRMNLIVGDNEAGKSTLLEAIHLSLTCQLNGRSLRGQLHPHLFNRDVCADFCKAVNAGGVPRPPTIRIELYLHARPDLARLQGSNNSRREDCPGISLVVELDDAFGADYAAYISKHISTIPVEYYTVEWRTFAGENIHPRWLPLRGRLIDASARGNERTPARYLLDIVQDCVDSGDRAAIAVAYRHLKEKFQENATVKGLNDSLASSGGQVSDKALSLSLDTTATGSWEGALMPFLDGIPFSMIGKGEQASLRVRLAMNDSSEVSVVLIEEPENHQSHTRLCSLIDRLQGGVGDKQIIVCTHSSFVINKLGLADVLLFRDGKGTRLTDLTEETQHYFRKIPGFDTLRMVLASKVILVEGPSDELVVQRAYLQKHGRLPIADGVDVISVGALAFPRFMEIASTLNIPTAIVTDNDGDYTSACKRWRTTAPNITLCIGKGDNLPSLEDQIADVNSLERLKEVLRAGKGINTKERLIKWMKRSERKTENALRIFDSSEDLTMPGYIEDAISI